MAAAKTAAAPKDNASFSIMGASVRLLNRGVYLKVATLRPLTVIVKQAECAIAQASGPDQSNPMCLLDQPLRSHLKPNRVFAAATPVSGSSRRRLQACWAVLSLDSGAVRAEVMTSK